LKWNGTSAVWYITPSSNKLTSKSKSCGFARTSPLIKILLFGKNPFPNNSSRLKVIGNFLKIKKD